MTIRTLVGALVVSLTAVVPAVAESHRLQDDFTFRRVRPPTAGAAQRITVQVAPQAPSGPAAPAAAGSSSGSAPGRAAPDRPTAQLGWFWEAVSPDMSASGPGRLQDALTALRSPPAGAGAPSPRLQTLQGIASDHGVDILTHTIGTRVSPALVLSVIAIESAGQVDAESRAGAQGLMQLIPATAERFGVEDSMNASQNIRGGVAYLDWLMDEFEGDPLLVLAAYNAGEGAVRANSGVPPFAETRDYVPKVLAAWQMARGLCVTPPELVSDGCVFVTGGS